MEGIQRFLLSHSFKPDFSTFIFPDYFRAGTLSWDFRKDLGEISALIYNVARRFQAPYSVFQLLKNHGDDAILDVQKYLEKNFGQPFSNPSIAAKFGMSLRAFERRFKKATGHTPLVYLRRVRVEAAKRLLETSNLNFAEITFQVGYEDVSSFRRVFIKNVGLRPKEYQQKFRYSL